MTTFDIDNTKKTKHREVLESLVEQAHALQAIHNPHTWRLSALTFALHLHDCQILFTQLKEIIFGHLLTMCLALQKILAFKIGSVFAKKTIILSLKKPTIVLQGAFL